MWNDIVDVARAPCASNTVARTLYAVPYASAPVDSHAFADGVSMPESFAPVLEVTCTADRLPAPAVTTTGASGSAAAEPGAGANRNAAASAAPLFDPVLTCCSCDGLDFAAECRDADRRAAPLTVTPTAMQTAMTTTTADAFAR